MNKFASLQEQKDEYEEHPTGKRARSHDSRGGVGAKPEEDCDEEDQEAAGNSQSSEKPLIFMAEV